VKKHIHLILITVIMLVGIFVRVYDFGNTPYGLNQDEASLGYDAWADMNYGVDRNGDHNPIYAVAWGSGQNMLYNYVVRPFIAILGLSVVAIRLPMLIFGIFTLIVFYLLSKRLFGPTVALISLFILSVCPWHIILSRWGLESNFAAPVIVFAMYCFARIKDNDIWFIPGMVFTALLMYAYSAHLFFLIIFVPAICIYILMKKLVSPKWYWIGVGAFLFVSAPMGIFFIVNKFCLDPIQFLGFTIPRHSMLRSDFAVSLFCKYDSDTFFQALAGNIRLMGDMLFKFSGQFDNYNAPNQFGALYIFMMPFMLIGITTAISKARKDRGALLLLTWFLCIVIENLIVGTNIVRMNIAFFPMIIFVVFGIMWIAERLKAVLPIFIIITCFATIPFLNYYFTDFNNEMSGHYYGGFDDAIAYATDNATGDIYMTEADREPYIISLFTEKIQPQEFLNTVQYDSYDYQFRHVIQYKNYISGIPDEIIQKQGDAYIFKSNEEIHGGLINDKNVIYNFENYIVIIVR
jgi:hypothetical protein